MPRPDLAESQPDAAVKQPISDKPAESTTTSNAATENPAPAVNTTPEPEPVADFDSRRFSVELTQAEAAALWPELFAVDTVPQPFAAGAPRDDFPGLTQAEWQRWLEPVDNERAGVSFEERLRTPIANWHGMQQLRCPWPRDGVLHFTPLESQFAIFLFWNGTQGTALVYHPHASCDWAAYLLERSPDSRQPKSIALVAVNKDEWPHAADHGFEIQHQDGKLIVSHSGTRLVSASFTGPPQSVYILGQSSFRAFGMAHRMAAPESATADKHNVLSFETPPDLEWISLPTEPNCAEFAARFEKLALQSTDRGDPRLFEKYRELLFMLPAWTSQPIDPLPISVALAEIIPLVDADRSVEVARICRSLRFWNQPSDPAAPWPEDRLALKCLVEWAEDCVNWNRARPPLPPLPKGGIMQSELGKSPHPWIIEQGRDAMSPALGLATAVADGALDDACKFITETPLPTDAGLVPDPRDSHMAVSWPQAIRNTLKDEPRLVAAMQSGFGRLGELRLGRAVAEGDAEAVRTASVQFLGTPIAADALLELGDRDLALGRFNLALARFQSGLREAVPEQADRLEQRVRLAASFLGLDSGRPARASMSLGEKKLTAEEFEALLAAQRRRAAVGNLLPIDQLTSASTTAPPPGRYELRPLVSCDVPTLSKSGDPATTGDQVHLSAHATDSLYMTGSLGTIAIALQQPAVRWSYPVRPDRTHAQNPERMTSAGDRLFWCRPTTGGLELTCLDAATGAVKWHKRHPDLPVISDPVWSQKQLLAVKADPPGQGVRRIALCELNPETGETISQTDIGGLISQETTDPPCALAAIDERLILATAAGVLCCDRSGQVHWLQRSIWLTPEVHDLATKARVEMALIVQSNGPVIVLQSGAAGLQAFDPETGRRVWQRATPDLTRVVGAAGGLIVAKTPRGLLAYQAADGAFVWQRDLPASPFACGLCHDGQVAIASAQPDENGKQWLSLQWISGSDNLEEKKASIELPEQRITSVIGLGAIAGRFFIVGYDKEHSAARLLELVPVVTEKP